MTFTDHLRAFYTELTCTRIQRYIVVCYLSKVLIFFNAIGLPLSVQPLVHIYSLPLALRSLKFGLRSRDQKVNNPKTLKMMKAGRG